MKRWDAFEWGFFFLMLATAIGMVIDSARDSGGGRGGCSLRLGSAPAAVDGGTAP